MPTYCAKIRNDKKRGSVTLKIVEASLADAERFIKEQYPATELLSLERYTGETHTCSVRGKTNLTIS